METDFKAEQLKGFRQTKLEEYKKMVIWQTYSEECQQIKAQIKERKEKAAFWNSVSNLITRNLRLCNRELNMATRAAKNASPRTSPALLSRVDHFTERRQKHLTDLENAKLAYYKLRNENDLAMETLKNGWEHATATTNPFED